MAGPGQRLSTCFQAKKWFFSPGDGQIVSGGLGTG